MIRILLTTLISVSVPSIYLGVSTGLTHHEPGIILFLIVRAVITIIIPVLLLVIIHSQLTKKIERDKQGLKMIVEMVILVIILQFGLWGFATSKVFIEFQNLSDITIPQMKMVFGIYFGGFSNTFLFTILIPILIPFVFEILKPKPVS